MTQNFDRWLAERLEDELPDPMAIPADPSAARYRQSQPVPTARRRGLPRLVRAVVPSVAAQLVLAGATVAVAVAAGAAATGHNPSSFIPAVGGASSATAPPQGAASGPGGATASEQGSGQSPSSKKGTQTVTNGKKVAPAPAASAAARSDDRAPDAHHSPDPRPSESPESRDHAAQPAPSSSPSPPPHTDH
jgi:hypothetical protein